MARGTYFGHVTEHVTLELSGLIGREVLSGRTVRAGGPADYDLILECPRDEPEDCAVVERLVALRDAGPSRTRSPGGCPSPSAELAAVAAEHRGRAARGEHGGAGPRGAPPGRAGPPRRRPEPAAARVRAVPADGVGQR